MPRRRGFTVELYEPQSEAALSALARHLDASGLMTSVELPDSVPVSKLKHGALPFAALHLALRNGRQPSDETVRRAVDEAFAALLARFGRAALDLNGTLMGTITES